MKAIETTSDLAELARVGKGCVLTIGNFDGVHIGHQEILAVARQIAAERPAELVVMTFEPHPLAVLHPERSPGILTPLALKKHLLAEFQVDCLLVVKSTRQLLALSPQDFVQRFLVENIRPAVVVEGHSFNFGSGRTGSLNLLQELGAEKGFEVVAVGAKAVELSTGKSVTVSSTVIREMLKAGSVADTAAVLGRPYRLIGRIVPGKGKGKQLGFPTANMQPSGQLVPAEGVYAGLVEIGDSFEDVCITNQKLPAAFSIGRFGAPRCERPPLIEAHLLMEDIGQLYDKWLAMDFVQRIRDQRKFHTESQLSAQIAEDCDKAKEILATK
jgi:riboflavin kinase/FMN adenylyltransferase